MYDAHMETENAPVRRRFQKGGPKTGRLNKPRRMLNPWWLDKKNPNYPFVEAREEKLAMSLQGKLRGLKLAALKKQAEAD